MFIVFIGSFWPFMPTTTSSWLADRFVIQCAAFKLIFSINRFKILWYDMSIGKRKVGDGNLVEMA